MKRSEMLVLVIIVVIGASFLYLAGHGKLMWFFIMGAAFVGECVEVVASRLERISTMLESQQESI